MKRFLLMSLVIFIITACQSSPTGAPTTTPALLYIDAQPSPTVSLPIAEGVTVEHLATLGDGSVYDAAWSPDNRFLALATTVGIQVYLVENLEMIHSLDVPGFASSVAFSPDGDLLAAGTANMAMGTRERWRRFSPWGSSGSVILWKTSSGEQLARLEEGESYVTRVKFSPDGASLAAAYMYPDSVIRVWDISNALTGETPPLRYRIAKHTRGVFDLDYSPDGVWLLSGSGDNSSRLWNASDGTQVQIVAYEPAAAVKVYSVAMTMNPTGDDQHAWLAAIGGTIVDKTVETPFFRLVDPLTGELVHEPEGHTAAVDALTFSPDGEILVTGSAYPESVLRVWETRSLTTMNVLDAHQAGIRTVVFSPDGTSMASTGWDGSVLIWDTTSWEITGEIPGHTSRVWDAVIHPDGTLAATAGDDGFAWVWDLTNGSLLGKYFTGNRKVTSVAFSLDGDTLIAGTGAPQFSVQLWDLESGTLQDTFLGHTGEVLDIAVSSDGTMIASAGGKSDSTIMLWETATGSLQQTFEGSNRGTSQVVFGKDDKWILAGDGGGEIRRWDINSAEINWEILDAYRCGITTIDLNEDGTLAAVGNCDGALMVWEPGAAQPAHIYPGICENVVFIAYLPGSSNFLVNCSNRSLNYWDTDQDRIFPWLNALTVDVMDIHWENGTGIILSGGEDGVLLVWELQRE